MELIYSKFFRFLLTGLFFVSISTAHAQTKKGTGVTKPATKTQEKKATSSSEKRELSDAEKKELAEAKKMIARLSAYHKGRFTRFFNSSTKEELMTLPGVGKVTAARIIAARPHETSAHVVLVKGIGLKTFKKFIDSKY